MEGRKKGRKQTFDFVRGWFCWLLGGGAAPACCFRSRFVLTFCFFMVFALAWIGPVLRS